MIRRFRNRKLSKDNQRDLAIMLKAICIDDGDAEVGESIIRNMEGGKMDEVAIEVASFMAHKTAERFADMVNGRRFSDIMQMVGGIQEADPVEAVRMLQMSKMEGIDPARFVPVQADEKITIKDLKSGKEYPQQTMEFVEFKDNPEPIGVRVVEGWALSDSPLSEDQGPIDKLLEKFAMKMIAKKNKN